MRPSLSICIPTWNRARKLDELLSCLCEQVAEWQGSRGDLLEVVVRDNASSDHTPEVLGRHAARYGFLRSERALLHVDAMDNFAAVAALGHGRYRWLLGDDDLPLFGAIPLIGGAIEGWNAAAPAMICLGARENLSQLPERATLDRAELLSTHDFVRPGCFHWLGRMSGVILREDFLGPGSWFAQRKPYELIALMRAVVQAVSVGPIGCLAGIQLRIRHESSNWNGLMAFAHCIEFPVYRSLLAGSGAISDRALGTLYDEKFLLKLYARVSVGREHAPALYRLARSSAAEPVGTRLAKRLIDFLLSPRILRHTISGYWEKRTADFSARLHRIREWDSRA